MHTKTMWGRKYLGCLSLALAIPFAASGCGQQGASENSARPATEASESASAPGGSSGSGDSEHAGHSGESEAETKLSFNAKPSVISVGQPSAWTLKVEDAKTGEPIKEFETEMTQKMHLIVVKKDLSWFNHVHPKLGADGAFTVQATLPREGTYTLYADATPKGGKSQAPQYEVKTKGAPASEAAPSLTPGQMRKGWITKEFLSHPEGQPDKLGGTRYQVALMPMPAALKAGQEAIMHFQVRDAQGKPLSDLQPYLGAMGHCVILSQDGSKYLHSHPMDEHGHEAHSAPPKSGGPDVMFHTTFPEAGLYKAWGQFQHKGQIITADFVVSVAPGEASAPAEGAGEHEGHSH